MTREQYLLTCLSEECSEVAQRCSKAIRFTSAEIQPGQELKNSERIMEEFIDLMTVMDLLIEEGFINEGESENRMAMRAAKRAKIEKFYGYSQVIGTVV